MTGCIAVLNAGSSSIKFALYEAGRDGALLFHGQVENIGLAAASCGNRRYGRGRRRAPLGKGRARSPGRHRRDPEARARAPGRPARARLRPSRRPRRHRIRRAGPRRCERHGRAREAGAAGAAAPAAQSRAHRVHRRGGARTSRRSPASTPRSIAPSRALAQEFALPRDLTAAGVRRYGFHGLSYDFIVSRLREIDPALATVPAGHRPSRQRRQPVRRRPRAAASPAPWASPPSTA